MDSLAEELDLLNTRALDPDFLVIFMDAKHIDVRVGKRLAKAAIYTAVGIDMRERKRVLGCLVKEGGENLERWKGILRNLLDRGLRRVLLFVQDAFAGLGRLTRGLFPGCEVQFCTMHMLRNARRHLGRKDFRVFKAAWKGVSGAWDAAVGARRFEELCELLEKDCPTWIQYLREHRRRLLAFLGCPGEVRAGFATTNASEAVNGQLETLRRNEGGYFQSRRSLKCRLALQLRRLHRQRWRSPDRRVRSELPALTALVRRFEGSW